MDPDVFRLAEDIGDLGWGSVVRWPNLLKNSLEYRWLKQSIVLTKVLRKASEDSTMLSIDSFRGLRDLLTELTSRLNAYLRSIGEDRTQAPQSRESK